MPNYNFSSEDLNLKLIREAWVQGLRNTARVCRTLAATEEDFKQKARFLESASEAEVTADKFTEWKKV